MKYIKPTDFVAVREFQAKYKRIEDDITELLTTDGSAATADELNKKLKSALNAAVLYLSRVNAKYTKEELSRAFNEGKGQADEPPKRTVAEVNEILSAQGFRYAKNAFSQNTYIELQQSMQAAGQSLTHRVNGIIKRLSKTGDDSIYNVQQAIVADLQRNGVLTVEYKNGAKQPISSYAAMAARSARIESTNIGSIGRALQAGTDLVIMTEMPQCCQVCGAYQGKVYSISGKDKRFPALFKTVLSRGYALPHPNCRHEFIPYFAEIEDPADVERMIKKSQIKYDSKGNLVDVRWQKDIQAYAAWQAGNRQRNDELHEYERMREYYAAKGIDAPYSTLAAFRRARRAESENYCASRKEWTQTPKENRQSPLTNAQSEDTIVGAQQVERLEYIPVDNVQAADAWLKERGIRGGYVDGKVNIEVANLINKTIDEYQGAFGVYLKVRSVRKWPKRDADFVAAYSPAFGDVFLRNVSSKTALKTIKQQAQEQFAFGAWSTGDVAHFIRHELGHAVHNGVGKSKVSETLTKIFQDATKDLEWGKHGFSYKDYDKKGLSASKYRQDIQDAGKVLSAYGLTSVNEMVAESIAEYMAGNPRPFAKKVVYALMGW